MPSSYIFGCTVNSAIEQFGRPTQNRCRRSNVCEIGPRPIDKPVPVDWVIRGLPNTFGGTPEIGASFSKCANGSGSLPEIEASQKEPRKLGVFLFQSAASAIDVPKVSLYSPHQRKGETCSLSGECGKRIRNRRPKAVQGVTAAVARRKEQPLDRTGFPKGEDLPGTDRSVTRLASSGRDYFTCTRHDL